MDCVFFYITIIKNIRIENEKKFIIDKLYGEKPKIVTAPSINGIRNITKNLLFNSAVKSESLILSN